MKKPASRVFRSVPGEQNVVLNFRRQPESEFDLYTRPFYEAVRALARGAFRRRRFRDLDALPIVFLYRHALELSMKAVVLEGNRRMELYGEGLPAKALWQLLNGHRLTNLLPTVRRVLEFAGWEWCCDDPNIGTFAEVHHALRDLERVDAESFAFRYPTNTRGQASVPNHFAFNLRAFVSIIDPLVEAFDTAAFGLSAEYGQVVDGISEQWR